MNKNQKKFQEIVWEHYEAAGRGDLPWRKTNDAYRIWVSEAMLQQTQVTRVVQKYQEFLKQFPTVRSLAQAPTKDVLSAWQGLGYNRRALALQRAAQHIVEEYEGKIPQSKEELQTLPGVGPYTAGAILAFAFHQPVVFIETNIRRAYLDYFFPEEEGVTDKQIEPFIEATLAGQDPREWYYALMDYGSALGRTHINANRRSAHYSRQSPFEGSDRQLRAAILRILLKSPRSPAFLLRHVESEPERVERAISSLIKDGFVVVERRLLRVV